MGLSERSYYQETPYDSQPMSMVIKLVIANAIVFLIDIVLSASPEARVSGSLLDQLGALHSDWYRQPWMFYQLVTHGFLHGGVYHILFNMLGLWMIGRLLESDIGPREFLWFYLVSIVVAGFVWSLTSIGQEGYLLGASGGVTAVIIVTVLRHPHEEIRLWGVFPMPFWGLGVLLVGGDLLGVLGRSNSNVAFTAHLAGAAFGFLYHRFQWRFSDSFNPARLKSLGKRKPKLRVVRDEPDTLAQEADRILEKQYRDGADSLTSSERKTLEKYSRELNKRRQRERGEP